ncbi:cation diffusion facilitator family transporter [Methanococcoides burtonii]|uniref:Cation efflux family protein n=1 Tax=Methanococcoides burtonii (strain DSM 6242 / NBRC 107633 / OCM 468 / ACE-M) TaxID=259564 RepID=Q12Y87_METBU|nr:cation diffusion facilitator family transporter [Methanococcoides burtonii]ABE51589.1 Cation efflux family protein [Methanococcoides burtonii DSM 6242]
MAVKEKLRLGASASKNSTIVLVFLAAIKGTVGFYSGSSSLIADAIHTSMDIFTSLAVWIGLKLSLKSSGEQFHYGYYKAENLVALFVSVLILLSGVELVRGVLKSIKDPVELEHQGLALGAAVFSVITIYALSQYKFKIGRQIGSQALIADATHSYTDVFSSIVVVVAITGSMFGIHWLDGVGVLVISLIIFKLGITTAKESALTLMDAWLDSDSLERIRRSVNHIPGVNKVDDIRLRRSGLVVFGEMQVESAGEYDLQIVEMLSVEIEEAVKSEIPNLEHISVDVKPGKISVLKVAIPIMIPEGLQSKLSRHIGKAPYYIFIELKDNKIMSWDIGENPAADLDRKRGVKTAEYLEEQDVNIVIVKDIGGGPFHKFHDSFIKLLEMPDDVEDVETLIGKIPELSMITAPTE